MKLMAVSGWLLVVCAAVCGCATGYSWKASVPAAMRTVTVPTFMNESDIAELGSVATRQLLREIQREGTFRIAAADEAALEIQGVVKRATPVVGAYDRRADMQLQSYRFVLTAEVSIIDKTAGKVLVNNRKYVAEDVFTARHDISTAERDASGRVADDLARQIVDDLADWKFEGVKK